jgi:hypothetical protein
MRALELKSGIHQWVDQVKDSGVLKAIQTLLQKQVSNDVVVFDGKDKALSLKAFINRIEMAEAEVKKGKYMTIDQLEKESEKW